MMSNDDSNSRRPADHEELAAEAMAIDWGLCWACDCEARLPECDCEYALPEERAYPRDDYACRSDFRHAARAALAVFRAHDPVLREAREALKMAERCLGSMGRVRLPGVARRNR